MPNSVDHWLEVCRSHMFKPNEQVKMANFGSSTLDAPFEQAFSNLAHAYLRESAPTLLDHELGFQLLDTNEDKTKAVGVFGFRVGSHLLYAPVFFLSGELKGHELLYLKNQDMFVPLKENWLNYLLNRKPNIIGAGVDRDMQQLGLHQPDLNRLTESPSKYASALPAWIDGWLPKYAEWLRANWGEEIQEFATHCQANLNLDDFVKVAASGPLEELGEMCMEDVAFAKLYDEWHGIDKLASAIKEARGRELLPSVLDPSATKYTPPTLTGSVLDKQAAADEKPDARGKIIVITTEAMMVEDNPIELDEEEAEKLLKDNVLIKDHRDGDEVSVAYNIDVSQKLTNPRETGIYQVLTKPGSFEKCLVISSPHGPIGSGPFCTVVRLDEGSRNWLNYPSTCVWTGGQDEEEFAGGEESWNDWFESLSDSRTCSVGSRYVAVGPRRNGTMTFVVEKDLGDGCYEVRFSYHCDTPTGIGPLPGYSNDKFTQYGEHKMEWSYDSYSPWENGERIHLDAKKGTQLRSSTGDVWIPEGYKLLKVTPDPKGDEDEPICFSMSSSDTPPIKPGNLVDAQMFLMEKTSEMRVRHVNNRYLVNKAEHSPVDTLVHLVRDHGLSEKTARYVMKQADRCQHRQNQVVQFRIKYASPFLTDQGPAAPMMPEPPTGGYNPMGFNGPTQPSYEEEVAIPDLASINNDPSIYNVNPENGPQAPMDRQTVQNAAASGQKEIFDVSTIGSMLKAMRDDTMVDRYLPDLIKGLDRLGRVMFMFYWHQEQFAERYGKQDLPELEDSLRNTFESLGDVVIFLKQKTIEPYPEEAGNDLELDNAASI